MKLILSMIKGHIVLFSSAIFFLTAEAVCDLLQPALMARIVDDGIKNGDQAAVLRIGGIMLAVALTGAVCAVIRNNLASRTSQKIGRRIRSMVYGKILSFSFENIDRLHMGSLITRATNDVTQIQNFINGSMRILIKAPIICIGAIVLIITQTPAELPVVGVILILCSALIAGNMIMSYPRFSRLQKNLDRLNDVSREFLTSVRVVKVFGREKFEEAKFASAAGDLADSVVSAIKVAALFGPLINLTVNISVVVLLWLGAASGVSGVGGLMASINYMTQILFSLGMISAVLNVMSRAVASAGRINGILDEKPLMIWAGPSEARGFKDSSVEFKNVSFRYGSSEKYALKNVSFYAASGETIGIIGSTGSGKTSLTNLIPRFYDASEGQVLIGGTDVRYADMECLRRFVSIVPQKATLFSGTIKDNLRWGKRSASLGEIRKAASAAGVDAFVSSFKDGYDTVLGRGGVNLSGGQKQRLSIARALLRKPNILILDDSASALDASTEREVTKGVKKYSEGATIFIISQKIVSVMGADKILVMDGGRLSASGTHEELMKECRLYREIYDSQIGDSGNDG